MPKKTQLDLNDKIDILSQIGSKVSRNAICTKFGISMRTLLRIIKNKEKIANDFQANSGKTKRLRQSNLPQLDKVLLEWFHLQRLLNMPLTGLILREKATQFAKDLNLNLKTDEVTDAWISRFKKRAGIRFKVIAGKSGSVEQTAFEEWLETAWPLHRMGFDDEDIFNADECGLLYQILPNKTPQFKGKKCTGGKMSNQRLTVLVCSNATGNVKMKLLVIGKPAKPRCFKSVRLNNLPVTYASNPKAWMTSEIFRNHLLKWDKGLKRAGRRILLLLDNCPAHPVQIPGLTNIKLVFLPANARSTMQPMDAGVINNLKHNYRKELLQRQILAIENKETYVVDVKEAVCLLARSWNLVASQTISNCFRRTKIITVPEAEDDAVDKVPDDEEILQLAATCDIELPEGFTMNDYVTFDDNLDTFDIPTDQEIIARACGSQPAPESDTDEELLIIEEKRKVSATDVARYLNLVRDYALESFTCPDSAVRAFTIISELESLVASHRLASIQQ